MKKVILFILIFAMMSTFAFAQSTITIKGSDTLVRLGQRWAEEYMKTHPNVTIQVSGGGSGTGIAALLNGATDVCEASRDMKEKEYSLAKEKGIAPFRLSVALDGIAIFLNEKNPVKNLTFAQLAGIYIGEITNWKEVGGEDARIILYGRENNSGTYAFFKEHVLEDEDYSEYTQTLPGTAAVVNAVSKDKYGIGYGGIAWAKGVKFAAVAREAKDKFVDPSPESVSNGTYPISRELYWFFNGKPTGEIKKLANWALSETGQNIAKGIDYVPLSKERAMASVIE